MCAQQSLRPAYYFKWVEKTLIRLPAAKVDPRYCKQITFMGFAKAKESKLKAEINLLIFIFKHLNEAVNTQIILINFLKVLDLSADNRVFQQQSCLYLHYQ